ncbi:divergent polysaccharide deacetylase family protein [Nannocystis radixulma]|uniref:Divergent polysaccharide deacetylase family protein n=1 Tax=Nannocystis radixulma TaxID=2995305 RepID=A0ABT5BCH4_9BACT|nr:divergent polysaccharide deacetylase family protein [Nannocystis radixulma]MDC0671234.1 divergent polysaccharide deacetylase family protein [Nannocystis radixulma]
MDVAAPRWARATLVAWWVVAAALFWLAPAPPVAPLARTEDEAIFQRQLDETVARTRRWQDSRGDLTIPWHEARGHLAIVIDDIGRELHHFDQLLALRFPLTFSVVPGGVYAVGAQLRLRADRRRPREILLHLPCEPVDLAAMQTEVEAREQFLRLGASADELRAALRAALERVPVAVGVNNHMGSRLTADRAAMDALMPELRQRGLFFLDSRTTPHSQALAAAAAAGVPALGRDVFLDHDPRPDAILAQLHAAAVRAREAPTVVIAHPSQEVVEALRVELPRLWADGIGVYPLREILARGGVDKVRE